MSTTTIDFKEKLALAKELGLKNQISNLEYKSGMFDLKFKPINQENIIKRLTHFKLEFEWKSKIGKIGIMIFLAGVGLCLKLPYAILLPITFMWSVLLLSLFINNTNVLSCWASDFQYEIPYGAMLAQKEAGQQNILNHRIYYPVWDSKPFTTNDDPIMVGEKNGKLYEIYAWNEEDVYDE